MKIRYLIVIIVFFISDNFIAQQHVKMSIEADVGYLYPFMGGNTNKGFNYGITILGSVSINVVKISTGLI